VEAGFTCAGEPSVCCAIPLLPCGTECVDTTTSHEHCGGCFAPCADHQTCVNSGCTPLCGNAVLEPGEDADPPSSPSSTVPVDAVTCRYDFSAITQLYCAGTCGNWGGAAGCQQEDANAFCQLKMDNPNSTATSFATNTSAPAPGICCPPPTLSPGSLGCVALGVLADRGVTLDISVIDTDLLASHGGGEVVTNVVCTDP
jgi:hypothetical protein